MGEHDAPRMGFSQFADVGGGEPLMHLAAATPGDDLDLGLRRNVPGKNSSGIMMTRGAPSDSTTFTALADVQQMSEAAFTAAEVLT